MGAYENPITVVDTESAKMWQQASANIAQLTINTINNIAARRTKDAEKEEQEITQRTALGLKNQEAALSRITKAGLESDAFYTGSMNLMDDITKLQGDVLYYTGDEEGKANLMKELSVKQSSLNQLIQQGTSLQDKINDYRNRRGFGDKEEPCVTCPGGMNLIGDENTMRYHKIMGALSGMDKGGLSSVYMKDGYLYGTLEGIEGEINLTLESQYDPGEIIDEKGEIEEALKDFDPMSKEFWDRENMRVESKNGIDQIYVPALGKEAAAAYTARTNARGVSILETKSANDIRAYYMRNAGKDAPKLNFIDKVGGIGKELDEESTKRWLQLWNERARAYSTRGFTVTEENADQYPGFSVGEFGLKLDGQYLNPTKTPIKQTTPTMEIYGKDFVVDDNFKTAYNFHADFLRDPLRELKVTKEFNNAELKQNGNILTLIQFDDEGDPTGINYSYNMNDSTDVTNLLKHTAQLGVTHDFSGTSKDAIKRRAHLESLFDERVRYNEKNKDPDKVLTDQEKKEKERKEAEEKRLKAIQAAKQQMKGKEIAENYREVKHNMSDLSLNYLVRKDGDEVLVTPKDKNKKWYATSKQRDELVLEIYNKKTGEYTPLTVKKVDKYQDDVGEGLKTEFNNLFDKNTSEKRKNTTFKEFLSTLSIKQAAEGKNAKNIRAYINAKTPSQTIEQLISNANKEGKKLPKKYSAFTDKDEAALDEFAKSKGLELQLDNNGKLVYKKIKIDPTKKPGE